MRTVPLPVRDTEWKRLSTRMNLGQPIQGTSEDWLLSSFPIATSDRKLLEPGLAVSVLDRHPFSSGRGWAEVQSMDWHQPSLEQRS
jgi:hypothetical protein